MGLTAPRARPAIVVVVGPTGAGKSRAALDLAQALGAEIVSADSQQVYRGMDIGTGKVSAEVRARVPHHLIDVVDPDQDMSARRFLELADAAIAEIHERGRPVIVAGGTMLYVRVLLFGIFDGPGRDPDIRARLERLAEEHGPGRLWRDLEAVDPVCAARIHERDTRRLVRALEVHELTGRPMSQWQASHDFRTLAMRYPALLLGIAPPRELLYQRIDARVLDMMDAGLLEEVMALAAAGYHAGLRSQQAIGYAELHRHLAGELDLGQAVALIQRNSRRYARRQLSWYRGDERVEWVCEPAGIELERVQRHLRMAPARARLPDDSLA